jgi:hypothetical protein
MVLKIDNGVDDRLVRCSISSNSLIRLRPSCWDVLALVWICTAACADPGGSGPNAHQPASLQFQLEGVA